MLKHLLAIGSMLFASAVRGTPVHLEQKPHGDVCDFPADTYIDDWEKLNACLYSIPFDRCDSPVRVSYTFRVAVILYVP